MHREVPPVAAPGFATALAGQLAGKDSTLAPGHHYPAAPARSSPRTGLLTELLSPTALNDATTAASRWQVPVHTAAIARGLITEVSYAQVVARSLNIPFAASGLSAAAPPPAAAEAITRRRSELAVSLLWHNQPVAALVVGSHHPQQLADEVAHLTRTGLRPILTTEPLIVAALEHRASPALLDRATRNLARRRPDVSASRRVPLRQIALMLLALGVPLGAFGIYPKAVLSAVTVALAVFFALAVVVRICALLEALRPRRARSTGLASEDAGLPIYSVLVPMVDEAEVLPDLVAALAALNYPAAKLDILLVLEQHDKRTRAAVAAITLPPFMRVIAVPDGAPRTKPKALNYALSFARGDYVVVYDAEDRPEPNQLRAALYAFEHGGPDLACVQAPLNIYNARQSWLSKQFALEYSALFDAILPALDRLGIPLPLGGTSNHFPRGVLDALLGWDPYNVTEDADLGIRIARRRWRTATITATTWEEAPIGLGQWFRQRTRWIKGWMQTILVHTRRHRRLRRDLGWWRTLGFHVYMGGLVLSALAHPWLYIGLAGGLGMKAAGVDILGTEPLIAGVLWYLAVVTLALGYAVSILANTISGARRGHWFLFQPLLTPVYWLLISAAAYRALYQLMVDPHRWEKTRHGLARATVRRPDRKRSTPRSQTPAARSRPSR